MQETAFSAVLGDNPSSLQESRSNYSEKVTVSSAQRLSAAVEKLASGGEKQFSGSNCANDNKGERILLL
jgi:hypothetical protein